MKARIPDFTIGGALGRIDDIVPPGKLDVSKFFDLKSLSLSDSNVRPFEEVVISWEIAPLEEGLDVSEFTFDLSGPDDNHVTNLDLSGSITVTPRHTSFVYIQGRKIGNRRGPLGSPLMLTVDDSDCRTLPIYREVIDGAINEEIRAFVDGFSMIELRSDEDVRSTWSDHDIRYRIPLKLVIPRFFDANVDVGLIFTVGVEHDVDSSELEISLRSTVAVDFADWKDVVSLGTSKAIEGILETVIPEIIQPSIQEIERRVLDQLVGEEGALRVLIERGLRIRDVTPVPEPGFEHLRVVLCPVPPTPIRPIFVGDLRDLGRVRE
jgi:hypothetical protein